jgi:probable HAF family extracellular repeat protein
MEDLSTLGGSSSSALGVNDAGEVVGYSQAADGRQRAFLYRPATGMLDLNTRIDPALGWELQEARGINRTGQIVGWGVRNGVGPRAFRLTPVAGGALSVLPHRLTFPSIPPGWTLFKLLLLRNDGAGPVAGSVESAADPFQVYLGGSFYLAPGERRIVAVAFAPGPQTPRGEASATLVITSSDPDAAAMSVPVTGRVH